MSRVGKQPIIIPSGVTITVDRSSIRAKGPKGELDWEIPRGVSVKTEDGSLLVSSNNLARNRAIWGTSRAVIANMVLGVTEGYSKKLEIEGVGYRAQLQGKTLVLSLGFSHPIEVTPRDGVSFTVEKNVITVSGIDKVLVGETAAQIRALKKPEPYKGKGIRYEGEVVRRKAGKKAAGAAE